MTPRLRVGVFGAGAIGVYTGGMMQSAHTADVIYVGRPSLIEDINAGGGINISRVENDLFRFLSAEICRVETSASALVSCDYVIVSVKAYQTEEAAIALSKHLRPKTIVVSLQNGANNADILRSKLSKDFTVLSAIVEFNVVWSLGARFHKSTDGKIILESKEGYHEPLLHALNNADVKAVECSQIQQYIYGKMLVNFFNPINALSGIPVKAMLMDRVYRHVWAAAVEEALMVLKKKKIRPISDRSSISFALFVFRLPTPLFKYLIKSLATMDETTLTSMAVDLLKGKPTEIDHIVGPFIQMGSECRIDTPILEKLVHLVHLSENERRSLQIPSRTLAGLLGVGNYDWHVVAAVGLGSVVALLTYRYIRH